MDMNKILQWMDLAKKYQTGDFWDGIFDQSSFEEFMKSNMDPNKSGEPAMRAGQGKKFPPTDIFITDEEVLLISDLAGYVKENIQLSVSGTHLLIKGSSHQMMTGEPVQKERYHGSFERVIQLPEPTFPNQIRAKFKNGLLFVTYKRQFLKEERVDID
ncbi:Hsp20/alpha crystallin family protein [Neobacillus niacini]|uniref:Hsp20/alpha crystallin family protein n=1 Tax=Neobacillus niacini TaxID=86668 RepID=UPI0007AB20EF|nr:Hsp20/alpha crystallin family protein [Neobacillus niacini]MEC1525949.1 Hsp20/alpha crystallin family protein [Neobacillus niacini]